MTEGQFESGAQSVLHVLGTAATVAGCVSSAWGIPAQAAVVALGGLVTSVGIVWSWLTSRAAPAKSPAS